MLANHSLRHSRWMNFIVPEHFQGEIRGFLSVLSSESQILHSISPLLFWDDASFPCNPLLFSFGGLGNSLSKLLYPNVVFIVADLPIMLGRLCFRDCLYSISVLSTLRSRIFEAIHILFKTQLYSTLVPLSVFNEFF